MKLAFIHACPHGAINTVLFIAEYRPGAALKRHHLGLHCASPAGCSSSLTHLITLAARQEALIMIRLTVNNICCSRWIDSWIWAFLHLMLLCSNQHSAKPFHFEWNDRKMLRAKSVVSPSTHRNVPLAKCNMCVCVSVCLRACVWWRDVRLVFLAF